MSRFALLTLSFRGVERVPTELGINLDRQRVFDPAYQGIFRPGHPALDQGMRFRPQGDAACRHARLTMVMQAMIGGMFTELWRYRPDKLPLVWFRLEGENCFMQMEQVLLTRSDAQNVGGVEGDDLLFVLLFSQAEMPAALPDKPLVIERRFQLAAESWGFLQSLGLVGTAPKFAGSYPPGFYFLPGDRVLEGDTQQAEVQDWLEQPESRVAACLIAAYLFYCYLICLRVERLTVGIDVNGDWDWQMRKLILARKKLSVVRKYALLKNRAAPDAPVLALFRGVSRLYRLEEQIQNLSELLDETSKAMETQNSYISAGRLRVIEVIVFLSTILGLGVGLNAIQMPPFYDQKTINVLERAEFWMVFLAVFGAALGVWLLLGSWQRFKRLVVRWWRCGIGRFGS